MTASTDVDTNFMENLKKVEEEHKFQQQLGAVLPRRLDPLVSNIKLDPRELEPHAWMTLRWAQDLQTPIAVRDDMPWAMLKEMEEAGFEYTPATLARWDQWLPHVEPVADAPETKYDNSRHTHVLEEEWDIHPLHARMCGTLGTEFGCYMQRDGLLFLVHVRYTVPGLRLSARKTWDHGEWYYVPASADLVVPKHWPEPARIWRQAHGQSLVGTFHLKPDPRTPSEMLEFLCTGGNG